ncbi:YisL family protein [Peribacillus frigoritolerans]|uniref:YisL family protein n=1 Tax=Peribacillus frigoritolerans TaxID=450367 RepID=UPI0007BF0807|nr:YisL family protein [Peribacillus frigoritolerans]MCK2019059.1 YisL family protein [Peribacillus frigoritolerans]
MTTHMHITAWVIGIILFFVTYSMLKGANPKAKMLHMITRLFYLLIFLTGGMLITDFGAYAVKMIVGIIVIAAMEMVLVRTKKRKSTGAMWILFIVALVFVLYLGFSLPQGMDFF